MLTHHHFGRYHRVLEDFVRPRNIHGTWLEQRLTYSLVEGVHNLTRDPGARTTLRYLRAITRHDRISVHSVMSTWPRSGPPDTVVVTFEELYAKGSPWRPVAEVLDSLSAQRWLNRETASR
jgi:hypothetical protein